MRGFIKALIHNKHKLYFILFSVSSWAVPSAGVALFYRFRDNLMFDKWQIGWLAAVGGVVSLIGAFLYGKYFHKTQLRNTLIVFMVLYACTEFVYMSCHTYTLIMAVEILMCLFGMIIHLAVMGKLAHMTVRHYEGVSMAVYFALLNIGGSISAWWSGLLEPYIHWNGLLFVAGVCNLLTLLILSRINLRKI